ncbi:MAG: DUF4384 domain-containing protein [Akkermansia sp.]|nr:DUF4384 domain-containing protein [Akkermansia sp.]
MPVILITDSSGNIHKYRLESAPDTPYTLGRSEDCNIALPQEAHISRLHCYLTAVGDTVQLQDNNSGNGIYDGEQRISCVQMVPGHEYRLANCSIVLRPEQAVQPVPTSPVAQAPRGKKTPRRLCSSPGSEFGLPCDFALQLRLLTPTHPLPVGSKLHFGVKAACACYVCLLQYDCTGTPTLLVPGCAGDDVRLFADTEAQFPRALHNEYNLVVEPPVGREIVIALACTVNQPFEKIWRRILGTRTELLAPGELEQKFISACSGGRSKWSSAVLHLQTCRK